MKKILKSVSVLTGCMLALSMLAACGGENEEENAAAAINARICYDNLPGDNISIAAEDTQFSVSGAENLKAYTFTGEEIADANSVATYENGVFTAKGTGIVTYKVGDLQGRLEVLPAYVTDPGNQYTGKRDDVSEARGEALLGNTHDPSFIETIENGAPAYYLFSTGWSNTTNVYGNMTYGNAIHRSTDLLTWELTGRTFTLTKRNDEFLGTAAGDWLYDGELHNEGTPTYSKETASWWAPDIVKCPSGGYWLYTCVVDGANNSSGMALPGGYYARACILLYHSMSLLPGSFEPVLFPEGHADAGKPVVLMQSSIKRGEKEADVNGIDPQIIYTPDGKMYMAYGSFGSGNYIIELDPETGMRKDGKGWQTHDQIRGYVADIQDDFGSASSASVGWEHDYYGKNISKANMEAPVIARHDNVIMTDETGKELEGSGKTYYYSMHSYDGLEDNYQMYGGRSDNVLGTYKSVGGGIVRNVGKGNSANSGNKYMGAFTWHDKSATSKEIDIILPGHNDLYTTATGMNLAAYITRTISYGTTKPDQFVTQIHQYYLNSYGDICINANRYSGEVDRTVSKEELLAYTDSGKFKMVYTSNQDDTNSDLTAVNVSVDVVLAENGDINNATGSKIGTWLMYGKGYIKIEFTDVQPNGEKLYYGVVRPAWLGDQNKSGFTITCLGHTNEERSMSLFLNNYSTLTGDGFVG